MHVNMFLSMIGVRYDVLSLSGRYSDGRAKYPRCPCPKVDRRQHLSECKTPGLPM